MKIDINVAGGQSKGLKELVNSISLVQAPVTKHIHKTGNVGFTEMSRKVNYTEGLIELETVFRQFLERRRFLEEEFRKLRLSEAFTRLPKPIKEPAKTEPRLNWTKLRKGRW